jgi:ribonuclease T2
LTNQGQTSLLNFMQTFWKDDKGDDNSFWSHEWSKHGTCMRCAEAIHSHELYISNASSDSTIGPDCVPDTQQAVVSYFNSAVNLFQKLPTYDWLTARGITPSSTKTYTRKDIVNALQNSSAFGFEVGLECHSGVLNQVNYYHNVNLSSTYDLFCRLFQRT